LVHELTMRAVDRLAWDLGGYEGRVVSERSQASSGEVQSRRMGTWKESVPSRQCMRKKRYCRSSGYVESAPVGGDEVRGEVFSMRAQVR